MEKDTQIPTTAEQLNNGELESKIQSRVENAPKIRGTDDIPYRDWADDD